MAKKKKKTTSSSPEGTMTLSGHLKELRNRLIVCVVALVAFFFIGINLAPKMVEMLTDMGKKYNYQFIYISPQELLLQYFSVAFLIAVILTLPVILYNVWAFVQPGLKKNENMLFLSALISGLIMFAVGVIFALKIMLPFMLHFLIDVSKGSDIKASVTVGNYLTFLFTVFIVFGIIFELPVISVILTQMGLLKVDWMKKFRKIVIVVIFVVAAIVTPPDVVSQVMVAIPMLFLYEFSIILCTILLKFRHKKASKTSEEDGGEEDDDESSDDTDDE